jgi:hypothetical protein
MQAVRTWRSRSYCLYVVKADTRREATWQRGGGGAATTALSEYSLRGPPYDSFLPLNAAKKKKKKRRQNTPRSRSHLVVQLVHGKHSIAHELVAAAVGCAYGDTAWGGGRAAAVSGGRRQQAGRQLVQGQGHQLSWSKV